MKLTPKSFLLTTAPVPPVSRMLTGPASRAMANEQTPMTIGRSGRKLLIFTFISLLSYGSQSVD